MLTDLYICLYISKASCKYFGVGIVIDVCHVMVSTIDRDTCKVTLQPKYLDGFECEWIWVSVAVVGDHNFKMVL